MTNRPEFIRGGRGKQAPYISTHVRLPEPIKPLVEQIKAFYISRLDQGIDPSQGLRDMEKAIKMIGEFEQIKSGSLKAEDKPVDELSDSPQPSHQPPKFDKSVKPVNEFKEGLTQDQLASRLGRNSANVGRHKKAGDISAWSQSLDPDGKSWSFDPSLKKYFPVNPLTT